MNPHKSSVRCFASSAAKGESILAFGHIILLDVYSSGYGFPAARQLYDDFFFLVLEVGFHFDMASAGHRFPRQPLDSCELLLIPSLSLRLAFVVSDLDCSFV